MLGGRGVCDKERVGCVCVCEWDRKSFCFSTSRVGAGLWRGSRYTELKLVKTSTAASESRRKAERRLYGVRIVSPYFIPSVMPRCGFDKK